VSAPQAVEMHKGQEGSAYTSIVLSQMADWVATPRARPGILGKRTYAGMQGRVQLLMAARTPKADEQWLHKLHQQANRRLELKATQAISMNLSGRSQKKGTVTRRVALPLSPMYREPQEVTSISRVSGRPRKAPRKFKEVVDQPGRRTAQRAPLTGLKRPLTARTGGSKVAATPSTPYGRAMSYVQTASRSRTSLPTVGSGSSGSSVGFGGKHAQRELDSASSRARCKNLAGVLGGAGSDSSESRLGSEYQVEIPACHPPTSCRERGDELLWSPSDNPLSLAVVDTFVNSALPFLGGPPGRTPTQARMQAAALEEFPEEVALIALQRAGFDTERALVAFASESGPRPGTWTKVEERQFRSGMGKYKKDLKAIQELVKTKDMKAIVRFFSLEKGPRKKQKGEKQRELELLKQSRSTTPVAAKDAALDLHSNETVDDLAGL